MYFPVKTVCEYVFPIYLKGLGSSKRKDLYYSRKVYENFRVFGYIDADLFEKIYISIWPPKGQIYDNLWSNNSEMAYL